MAYGAAIYGDGSGDSAANAINIDSAAAWATLAATSADWGKYFKVSADIDFEDAVDVAMVGAGAGGFTGNFDGQFHTLKDFTITTTPYAGSHNGMFRFAGATAVIKNLKVNNVTVTGSDDAGASGNTYAGIICAEMASGGVIDSCDVTNCTLTHVHTRTGASSKGLVGPVCGSTHGTVMNCHVYGGTVKADPGTGAGVCIGGVVGYQTDTSPAFGYCLGNSSTAAISTLTENPTAGAGICAAIVGGIVGYMASTTADTTVYDCHFHGSISYYVTPVAGSLLNVGGVVGKSTGVLSRCMASGTIAGGFVSNTGGGPNFGGVVGENTTATNAAWKVIDCVSMATLAPISSKSSCTGGVYGTNYGVVTDCRYAGAITPNHSGPVGGIGGYSRTGSSTQQCMANIAMNIITATTGYNGGAFGQTDTATINNCYVKGTIQDDGSTTLAFNYYGGFIGYNNGATISYCYSSVGPWSAASYTNRCGFVGIRTSGTYSNCFWDSTVSGRSEANTGATAKTSTELKALRSAATGFNWDTVWRHDIKGRNGGYPFLQSLVTPVRRGRQIA